MKDKKLGQSNIQTSLLQDTNIKKNKLTAYVIIALTFLGSTASFWHIFADKNSTISYFGFKNLEIFLYVIGNHLTLFFFSLFIFWVINFIPNSAKSIKSLIGWCVDIFMVISLYYIAWVFIPKGKDFDFPINYYRIFVAFTSIALTIVLFKLVKVSFNYLDVLTSKIDDLTSKIRELTSFIVLKGEKHIPEGENRKKYIIDYLKLFKDSFLKIYTK